MTVLLALDCAAGACSVAVAEDGVPRANEELRLSRGHGEALVPMVERVLAAAGRAPESIGAVAATVGPGSFTGLRIGLAAARGLALAVGAGTVAVTTLEALAEAAAGDDGRPVLAALDSKRGDLYAQWFAGNGSALGGPAVMSPDQAMAAAPGPRFRIAGDVSEILVGAARSAGLQAEIADGCEVPDARVVARLATARLARGETGPLRPLYLRAPAVSAPSR